MSIGTLAAVLALASFAALTCVALAIRAACRVSLPKHPETHILFLHAIAPTVAPAVIAFGLLLPSFLMHEQARDEEWTGLLLPSLALCGVVRLIQIAVRGVRALHTSQSLVRTWRQHATPLAGECWGARASRIDVGFPVVAVAGFFRPHVFVDRRVLEACSDAELEAIAAHERSHISSYDNLRRLIVTACAGYSSKWATAWRVAAEWTADERAVRSEQGAVDLARALLRLARLAPAPSLPVAAISTIHDGGSLATRVQRLLELSPGEWKTRRTWPAALAAATIGPLVFTATPLPAVLHAGLEVLVRNLP
jgi:Zn-dependent protease with chaperone function